MSQKQRLTFKNWIIYGVHRYTIWGVDPGKTDVFVAVDGSSTNPHRFRKTSSKEYYDLCGYNQAKNKQRRWMEADDRTRELIDGMTSLKTTNLENLREAITYRLTNFLEICRHYDQDKRYRVQKFKIESNSNT